MRVAEHRIDAAGTLGRPLAHLFQRLERVLLDAEPQILGSFPEALRARAALDLDAMGVEIHAATRVTGVAATGVCHGASTLTPPTTTGW